jgi:hypothetical protein
MCAPADREFNFSVKGKLKQTNKYCDIGFNFEVGEWSLPLLTCCERCMLWIWLTFLIWTESHASSHTGWAPNWRGALSYRHYKAELSNARHIWRYCHVIPTFIKLCMTDVACAILRSSHVEIYCKTATDRSTPTGESYDWFYSAKIELLTSLLHAKQQPSCLKRQKEKVAWFHAP